LIEVAAAPAAHKEDIGPTRLHRINQLVHYGEIERRAVRPGGDRLRRSCVADPLVNAVERIRVHARVATEERRIELVRDRLCLLMQHDGLDVVLLRERSFEIVVHVRIATEDFQRLGQLREGRRTLDPGPAHAIECYCRQRRLLRIGQRRANHLHERQIVQHRRFGHHCFNHAPDQHAVRQQTRLCQCHCHCSFLSVTRKQ